MRKHELSIANFICTFGQSGVLIDFLEEIILPTFFRDTLIRTYGETSYYIYEPALLELGERQESELAIVGRFVKDTMLRREQVVERGQLKEDHDAMASAPSIFFVLLLQDHRLLYFSETPYAPDISTFSSTLQIFMRRIWRETVQNEHGQRDGRSTLKELEREFPRPVLNILPVAKTDTIAALMREFGKIEKIKFRLIKPNDETDASAVFQSVRDKLQPLNPTRLDLEVADADGLNKEESVNVVKEAAEGLNTSITVTGKDAEGNVARADNHEFALKIPIDDVPNDDSTLAKRLYAEFVKHVGFGSVRRGEITQKARQALEAIKRVML